MGNMQRNRNGLRRFAQIGVAGYAGQQHQGSGGIATGEGGHRAS